MKWFFFSLSVVFNVFDVTQGERQFEERLSAVTYDQDLYLYYRTLQIWRKSRKLSDQNLDAAAKKRICHHITSSGYFRKREKVPVDFDSVYDVISDGKVKTAWSGSSPFRMILRNYDRKSDSSMTMMYTHPTKIIKLDLSEMAFEYVFECLTGEAEDKNKLEMYYISDVYNVNEDHPGTNNNHEDDDFDGYIAARFVFRAFIYEGIDMGEFHGLAEEPATAFSDPEYNVEDIYLGIRAFYKSMAEESQDPLCSLSKSKKNRICASVMSSQYFENKVIYLPPQWLANFEGKCEKLQVSLQSDEADWKFKDTIFEEWMLSCKVEPIDDNSSSIYFVSRAYNTNFVFVYGRDHLTKLLYLKNVSKNVAVVIDKCKPPHCFSF